VESYCCEIDSKVLLLTFDIKNKENCQEKDCFIEINGISNKVTCDDWLYKNNNYQFSYAFSPTKDSIDVIIEKGSYEIDNIHFYSFAIDEIKKRKEELIPVENFTSKIDSFLFDISLEKDGYLVTSLPFDLGYTIKVDGMIVENEIVNTAFLGAKLKKGNHHIEIIYQAPLANLGKLLSGLGVLSFFILMLIDYKSRENRKCKDILCKKK